jgi:hypothetical protein
MEGKDDKESESHRAVGRLLTAQGKFVLGRHIILSNSSDSHKPALYPLVELSN